jgi:hypothetical protein
MPVLSVFGKELSENMELCQFGQHFPVATLVTPHYHVIRELWVDEMEINSFILLLTGPISLLATLGKILESVVAARISHTVEISTSEGSCPIIFFLSTLSTKLRAFVIWLKGYSGRSFRKGAAQHAHDSGILSDQIQTLGIWLSEAFRVYFTTKASVLYHQFQRGSPASLSFQIPPPFPPPS